MAVFDLEAVIKLTDDGFKAGLSKAGQAVGTFAKVTGAAFVAGGAAIAKLTKSSVEAYADFEQLSGGVQKLFGGAADEMMQFAQDAYKTAGMSANQYMEQATSFAAALIQSYEGDASRAAHQADVAMRAISDNFNTFGGDIASVQAAFQGFAKQNYTMLDNLKLGYGGTKTEMERLIADANEYAEAMGRAGDLSIENFGDVVEAIELIQEKQGIAGTTAREAATTISGSLEMTKAAWQNLLVAFSDKDADLSAYFDALTESATNAFNNIIPVAEQAISGIGTVIEGLAPTLGATLPAAISSLLPSLLGAVNGLVTSIAGSLPEMIGVIIDTIVAAAPLLVSSGIQLFVGLAVGLVQAIPRIVAALPQIWAAIKTGVAEALPSLMEAGSQIVSMIGEGISSSGGIISEAWEFISSEATEIWNSISGNLSSIWESIVSIAQSAFEGLQSFWATWGDSITSTFGAVWDAIKTAFSAAMDILSAVFAVFSAAFSGDWAATWNAVKALASSIWNGITSVLSSAWNAIKSLASTAWGIFQSIITGVWDAIAGIASAIWSDIASTMSSIWASISATASSIWNSIASTISSIWNGISSAISSVLSAISSAVSSGFNAVSSTVSSIWNGISSTISSVMDGIKDTVRSAIEKLKSFFDFDWSLPHIALPHFTISGEFSLKPPSVPTLSVSWYKKALGVPFMFQDATIFGAGEAGDEILYGRDALMQDIKEASGGSSEEMEEKLDIIIAVLSQYLPELATRPVTLDGKALVGALGDPMDEQLGAISSWKGRGLSMA